MLNIHVEELKMAWQIQNPVYDDFHVEEQNFGSAHEPLHFSGDKSSNNAKKDNTTFDIQSKRRQKIYKGTIIGLSTILCSVLIAGIILVYFATTQLQIIADSLWSINGVCPTYPCFNGGSCRMNQQQPSCVCPHGYSGDYCEKIHYCVNHTCLHGGSCIEDSCQARCQCLPYFRGSNCEIEKVGETTSLIPSTNPDCFGLVDDVCTTYPCFNGGSCRMNQKQPSCVCPHGYSGDYCEKIHYCDNHSCLHGGSCIEDSCQARCECPLGYHGNNCEIEKDDGTTSVTLTTNPDCFGLVDDVCTTYPCFNGGSCRMKQQQPSCVCPHGYSGDYCEKIHYCDNHTCLHGGSCVEDSCQARCECPLGYHGINCEIEKVDETTSVIPTTNPDSLMLNNDVCTIYPCFNGCSCRMNQQQPSCVCPDEYSGVYCEKVHYCVNHTCLHGGNCSEDSCQARCECPLDYHGNNCEIENVDETTSAMTTTETDSLMLVKDVCTIYPCFNGGSCRMNHQQPSCVCPDGYSGDYCEKIHYCVDHTCLHGGSCIEDSCQARCECPLDYHGNNCEIENIDETTSVIPTTEPDSLMLVKDVCTIYHCFNGGSCRMNQHQPSCVCPHGFSGDYCEEINYCAIDTCLHGGSCIEDSCQARCECPLGYHGNNCEQITVWPAGSYGLPQTNTGCPVAADVSWVTGWRKQDTENRGSNNTWTNPNHFVPRHWKNDMEQHFCIKTAGGEGNWPKGNYCIFKKGVCPEGFSNGSLFWDDEDDDNTNAVSGFLPDGKYDRDTLIYYCCRADAGPDSAIDLPINVPFFLFRYSSRCQQVRGATVREEYFHGDDEDIINRNSVSGSHPYEDGGAHNHRIHYCYYSRS